MKGPWVLQGRADIVGAKAGEGTTFGINMGDGGGKGSNTDGREKA